MLNLVYWTPSELRLKLPVPLPPSWKWSSPVPMTLPVIAKRQDAVPLTRDYIGQREAALRLGGPKAIHFAAPENHDPAVSKEAVR